MDRSGSDRDPAGGISKEEGRRVPFRGKKSFAVRADGGRERSLKAFVILVVLARRRFEWMAMGRVGNRGRAGVGRANGTGERE